MFGEHASFIIPAYLITAVALGATTLAILRSYKARKAEISSLEDNSHK